jgi:membrane associated rhomboid family serine protease
MASIFDGGNALRSFIRAVDKFSLTHRRFGIPRLMLYIIIGNVAVYLISALDPTRTFAYYIAFDPSAILRGQIWRLVTWVFSPAAAGGLGLSSLFFTALLLYFYYFIGQTLEREWGTPKFNIYYLFGMLLNILFGFAVYFISGRAYSVAIDTSYLNLSMFFAFAVLFPEQRVMLFFVIPIKIKWLALVDAAFFVLQIIASLLRGNVLGAIFPIVAILNFILFCGDDLMSLVRPYKVNNSKQAINFRKAAKQHRREVESHPYRHKCAVCGKTDADYPNLEFRYCSRCTGYHCFCADHINNHVHFQ